MTTLLYQTDSYLKSAEAVVAHVLPQGVVLDRSPLYPGGGGQPADAGTLRSGGRDLPISSVRRIDGKIVHLLTDGHGIEPAARVQVDVDWERRYQLMRTHTAMHILCGVVWRDYGAQVTGGNMEPGKGRLDFEFERMERELIDEIEAKINAEVEAARNLRVRILPREEAFAIPDLIRTKINLLPPQISEVRTVEIEGLDLQADGGTHVANTREVGPLKILNYKSKGRINKRILVGLASD